MKNLYQEAFLNARLHWHESVRGFAQLLEISHVSLLKIERGENNPKVNLLKKLETITGRSVWAWAGGRKMQREEDAWPLFYRDKVMAIDLEALSDTQKKYVHAKCYTEAIELEKEIERARWELVRCLEKSYVREREIEFWEKQWQMAQQVLEFLQTKNALKDLIQSQQEKLAAIEEHRNAQRLKEGIFPREKLILAQMHIEDLEQKRQNRWDSLKLLGKLIV